MKFVYIERPNGLDRLSTWNEIRGAVLFSSTGTLRVAACDAFFHGMDSHLYGSVCDLPEDIAWLDIVSQMPDSLSN